MHKIGGGTWLLLFMTSLVGGIIGGTLVKKATPRPQLVVLRSADSLKAIERHAAQVWPDLQQKQIDDLTALLSPMDPKPRAAILCRARTECGSMALDLENAFESAKWPVKIDAPFDEPEGITVNSERLRGALSAVGIEAKLVALPSPAIMQPETPTIVIGRRPRS